MVFSFRFWWFRNSKHTEGVPMAQLFATGIYTTIWTLPFEAPDYEYIHKELKKPGVTLKLLHDEYVEKCTARGTIPMGKTKSNEGYAEYMLQNNLTGRISHKPGERCEVDWSGTDMHYIDTQTGELIKVHLFVATLPYSQYSYVEPCLKMDVKRKFW